MNKQKHKAIFLIGTLTSVAASVGGAAASPVDAGAGDNWQEVYRCEGDEAIVDQRKDDPSSYRVTVKNGRIRDTHLQLKFGPTDGVGAPTLPGESFVGFSGVVNYFWKGSEKLGPSRTAHVFPEHGGLKIVVDAEPFYVCTYTPTFGDPGGSFAAHQLPLGVPCPDLRPHYSFRNASGGSDSKTSRDWFFQNCQDSSHH